MLKLILFFLSLLIIDITDTIDDIEFHSMSESEYRRGIPNKSNNKPHPKKIQIIQKFQKLS